jgi:WXG100 family type VII secretion target
MSSGKEETIDTEKIYATHAQIKEIVESYKTVNLEVSKITQNVKENWVGEGRNEFESQYNLLIRKVDDFGDALKDIYDALVQAEADYEATDDQIRQQFTMAMDS